MNVMIDLETMATTPDALILTLGAAAFDYTGEVKATIYRRCVVLDQQSRGRAVDMKTVLWWAKQPEEVREEACGTHGVRTYLPSVLVALTEFCGDYGVERAWSNGAGFDIPILEHAYRQNGQEFPIPFRNHRCFRTVKNLFHVEPPERVGDAHNALADAMHQCAHLHAIHKATGVEYR